jgi:hypothetical protein
VDVIDERVKASLPLLDQCPLPMRHSVNTHFLSVDVNQIMRAAGAQNREKPVGGLIR